MTADRPRCKCGVYESAHLAGRGCGNYRKASALRLWRMDHPAVRHVFGRVWLALPEKRRWGVVTWIYKRHPEVCWCDLVDAAYLDAKRDDYAGPHGCPCDVPLPINVGEPVYGDCYCVPPSERIAS